MHAHVLHPPDYTKDYFLYIVESETTVGMVLVHEENKNQEQVIYYLSKSLIDSKTRYSHVDMLASTTVIAVQRFHHYIFLRTTIVISNFNPMYCVLTHQVLWGIILVGLLSFRNLISISPRPLRRNPWFSQS